MKKALAATAAIAVLTGITVSAAPAATAAESIYVSESGYVWIYGNTYKQTSGSCFGSWWLGRANSLQVRGDSGKWVTLDSSSKYVKDSDCTRKYPYTTVYRFTLTELGDRVDGDEYQLEAREVLADGTKKYFTKTVYPSRDAHAQMLSDTLMDMLQGAAT
jgi:hypothetical protein